uniref:hypothetical protein n=1 Tax=Eubacterium cellulosolvens TaxID=29322 RepID=UPI0004880E8C|nr:hypothetical protein [[Eubacterium] cellulosolvens]
MNQNIPKQKSRLGSALAAFLVTAVIGAVIYYLTLPALNLHSEGFWTFMVVTTTIFVMLYYIFTAGIESLDSILELEANAKGVTVKKASKRRKRRQSRKSSGLLILIPMFFFAFPIVIGFISGSRFFHAKAYSNILTVKDGDVDKIPSSDGTDSIALMDTASAEKLGDRKIGSLTSVVSQYDVSAYTQIDYKGKPVKTSPLRYAGFFKWAKNRGKGIPGYVIVDPVSMSADYKSLGSGMTYVPSAYFNENLRRHLRFSYPTKMFTNIHFEIDESGKPWYIAPTYEPTIGLFGGEQINGAVICDPVSGDSTWYPVGKIPRWTDVVFSGDLICEQYNNHAQLHEGFWNSIIGQTGCRKVTEYEGRDDDDYLADYGYVAKDGDIWIYTGVTSLNNDSSNIGFIMSNERTEETIFITCPGADEFSAMAAAQGEVQEKRYAASFPSLILVDGNPTYIMVMKDASGLVKMYAAVNVEQYNMVATATKQKDCIDKYRALIGGEISQEEATGEGAATNLKEETGAAAGETAAPDLSDAKEKTIKVKKMQTIDRGGNTWLYVVDTENRIYAAKYEDVLDMLLVEEGDEITIRTDGTYFAFEKK